MTSIFTVKAVLVPRDPQGDLVHKTFQVEARSLAEARVTAKLEGFRRYGLFWNDNLDEMKVITA